MEKYKLLGGSLTGIYYLWIRTTTDVAGNAVTEGTTQTVSSTSYQVYGPYYFDNTAPEITIKSYTTRNVIFTGTDNYSGIVGYTVTDSSEEPSSYTEVNTNSLEETTIDKLTQSKTYYVWMIDALGNSTYKNFDTETVPDTISFSTVEWDPSVGTATTTISTTATSYYVQYQLDSTDEEGWTTIGTMGQGITLENLENDTVVYARLWDGYNGGKNNTLNIKDAINPTVTVTLNDYSASWIEVSVSASDAETGLGDSPIYTYSYKSSSDEDYTEFTQTTETTCKITDLEELTSYTIKVSVTDRGGNTGSNTVTKTTETLVGLYVNYTPDSDNSYAVINSSNTLAGTPYNTEDFTTDTSLHWRIWSVDDNTLTLISDNVARSGGYLTNGTYYLYLSSSTGYNNGVKILNDICNTLYSNDSLGATARSLDIVDIEEVMDWDVWAPTEYVANANYFSSPYLHSYEYTSNRYYPYLWQYEDYSNIDGTKISASYTYDSSTGTLTYESTDGGLRRNKQTTFIYSSEGTASRATTSIEPTETYWNKSLSTSNFKNSKYYYLIYKSATSTSTNLGAYWLASRYVGLGNASYANFGLQYVGSGSITGYALYYSSSGANSYYSGLRPVVSISLDSVTLNTNDTSGLDTDNMFELE